MARDLPIGNGNVLVNYDKGYNLRDIYYPYVGQENHAMDHLSHFGVWSDLGFCWIDDPAWVKELRYMQDSLVTDVQCRHEGWQLEMRIRDTVDISKDALIRKVKIKNNGNSERQLKLYFHLDLHIRGNAIGDTVYYEPDLNSLVFYKAHRWFSLSCANAEGTPGPAQFATGQKEIHGLQGTWKDAMDGTLGGSPIAQGSVDGTIGQSAVVPAGGETVLWFWVGFGRSREDILEVEHFVRKETPQARMDRTHHHWQSFIGRDRLQLDLLPPEMADFYKRSLCIILSNTDRRGAIIAANDSDILKFARDTYSYMWPRDGALISHALDRAGYHNLTHRFFDFCKKTMAPDGYLMHKYNPDGSIGSSWHPHINYKGEKQLPIQEDETALVIYTMWHHHKLAGTLNLAKKDYENFIVPAGNFLVQYRDASGLPLPSYDLWEERYGVFSFTVAAVYAGLLAASNFADYFKDTVRSLLYQQTAAAMKKAVESQLYSEQHQRFIRGLIWNAEKNQYDPDVTIDASIYALFDFEMFMPDDPRICSTMEQMEQKLTVQTDIGGIARYEDDYYLQVSQDIAKVPGNPWFICTLWLAEWKIATAKSEQDLEEPKHWLEWTMKYALPSGVLSEQIDPYTGAQLSVSPLTWSQASFVKVIQEYLSKLKKIRDESADVEDRSDRKLLDPVNV